MVTPGIQEFADQIAARFSPERVILFGSHARNEEGPDSDVDILVVLDHNTDNIEKAVEIRIALDAAFPLDLFVRRPKDIDERLKMRDYFIREIFEQGKTLYDSRLH
jgi:uncharacterized protein